MNYTNHDLAVDGWRVQETGERPSLRVRTTDYARRVISLYAALPKSTVAQVLGKQLLRSGTSVGANYRESARARSKAEFIAKIGDCLKELDESSYWLELLDGEKIFSSDRLTAVRDETDQLISIFVTSLNRAKAAD